MKILLKNDDYSQYRKSWLIVPISNIEIEKMRLLDHTGSDILIDVPDDFEFYIFEKERMDFHNKYMWKYTIIHHDKNGFHIILSDVSEDDNITFEEKLNFYQNFVEEYMFIDPSDIIFDSDICQSCADKNSNKIVTIRDIIGLYFEVEECILCKTSNNVIISEIRSIIHNKCNHHASIDLLINGDYYITRQIRKEDADTGDATTLFEIIHYQDDKEISVFKKEFFGNDDEDTDQYYITDSECNKLWDNDFCDIINNFMDEHELSSCFQVSYLLDIY